MCYSGRCSWEDHMGDCVFPSHIKNIQHHSRLKCSHSAKKVQYIRNIISNYYVVLERKEKINKIKNRLLDKKI